MFCEECEQIFSKLESYFASKIFYPFVNKGERNIVYDDTLIRFIISLSWRTLKIGYASQVTHTPWIKEHVDKAERVWRKFLLHESLEAGPYEHHMCFLDYVEKADGLPSKFQWYILRATDATLVSNESDRVFAYTHFPCVFFVSTIFPLQLSGWIGTKIEWRGKTTLTFKIGDTNFGDFLVSRAKIVASATQNAANDDKILKSVTKNPERFLTSESFKVLLEESKRERQEKLKSLPKAIEGLVDIIERSLESPGLNSLQQKSLSYAQNIIANELSNLPNDKATKIHSLIETTIRAASITKIGIHCDFETVGLICRFMVCFTKTKDEQRELVKKAIDELIKKRAANDRRFIVVFSFNPLDDALPYETGYYL